METLIKDLLKNPIVHDDYKKELKMVQKALKAPLPYYESGKHPTITEIDPHLDNWWFLVLRAYRNLRGSVKYPVKLDEGTFMSLLFFKMGFKTVLSCHSFGELSGLPLNLLVAENLSGRDAVMVAQSSQDATNKRTYLNSRITGSFNAEVLEMLHRRYPIKDNVKVSNIRRKRTHEVSIFDCMCDKTMKYFMESTDCHGGFMLCRTNLFTTQKEFDSVSKTIEGKFVIQDSEDYLLLLTMPVGGGKLYLEDKGKFGVKFTSHLNLSTTDSIFRSLAWSGAVTNRLLIETI